MPCRNPQAAAQLLLGRVVERAIEDQSYRAAHELWATPCDALGPPVRPTLETRPVPGRLGRGGQWEPSQIPGVGPRTAPRPTVDTRSDHAREGVHRPDIPAGSTRDWPYSDTLGWSSS